MVVVKRVNTETSTHKYLDKGVNYISIQHIETGYTVFFPPKTMAKAFSFYAKVRSLDTKSAKEVDTLFRNL